MVFSEKGKPHSERFNAMPEISRFLGIVIRMYYRDHAPTHSHAEYGEYEITVQIETGVIEGKFPRRAISALVDWYELHKNELLENWTLTRRELPLNPIDPLE